MDVCTFWSSPKQKLDVPENTKNEETIRKRMLKSKSYILRYITMIRNDWTELNEGEKPIESIPRLS